MQGPGADLHGCLEALQQVSGEVRFADAKATVLTAGFGVVLTLTVGNVRAMANTVRHGGGGAVVVTVLSLAAVILLLVTLFSLLSAINPRIEARGSSINRFAWPTLTKSTPEALAQHVQTTTIEHDAWATVLALSDIADRKFAACRCAVRAFAGLATVCAALVATAQSFG